MAVVGFLGLIACVTWLWLSWIAALVRSSAAGRAQRI
jgi:hypothetical protein